MANTGKIAFLKEIEKRFGALTKLEKSQSLYEIRNSNIRIYIRYSKTHQGQKTFYGLREDDLIQLEGHPSVICFLWDNQKEPLILSFSGYEEIFKSTSPARDGQYKLQIYLQDDGTELYIARLGRFNVESYFGWHVLENLVDSAQGPKIPELSHAQIQTLLGAIGVFKGFEIWIPRNDRRSLDWALTQRFECCNLIPYGYEKIKSIIEEVDVIWIQRGASKLRALFEIEHSTPVYSGLLRFNDIHLLAPNLRPRFSIVSNDARRSLFVRQLNRPTFLTSRLNEICTFLEYGDVYGWFNRVKK